MGPKSYNLPVSSLSEQRAIRNTYSTALMSNTKWRRVFLALQSAGLTYGIYSFFNVLAERGMRLPTDGMLADRYVLDSTDGPYPYYRIIWLEIPAYLVPGGRESFPTAWLPQDLDAARAQLAKIGQLPISETARGLRITGYAV